MTVGMTDDRSTDRQRENSIAKSTISHQEFLARLCTAYKLDCKLVEPARDEFLDSGFVRSSHYFFHVDRCHDLVFTLLTILGFAFGSV